MAEHKDKEYSSLSNADIPCYGRDFLKHQKCLACILRNDCCQNSKREMPDEERGCNFPF